VWVASLFEYTALCLILLCATEHDWARLGTTGQETFYHHVRKQSVGGYIIAEHSREEGPGNEDKVQVVSLIVGILNVSADSPY